MEDLSSAYGNYSNISENVSYHLNRFEIDFYVIGYSISAVLSILLNCINIVTVPRVTNCFGENTKLCFMSLAIVDLFTGLVCSTSGVLFSLSPVPAAVRDVIVILCTAVVWQSMCILTLASVDRYVAVTRPLQYTVLFSKTRMIGALTAVMIIGLVNSGGAYLQSKLLRVCHPYGSICSSLIKPSYVIYNILPFAAVIVTTFANARLLYIARQHARQIAAQEAAVNAGNIALPVPSGAGMKGLKTVFVITCVFYLAWLPGTIISFLSPIPSIHIPWVIRWLVRYAITSNSWWNACVYWIMSKSYRKELIQLLPCRLPCFAAPQAERRVSENPLAYIRDENRYLDNRM